MKFCNNTNFTLPKQSQRSRSILQDGSRSLGLFWKEKKLKTTEEIQCMCMELYSSNEWPQTKIKFSN